MDGHRRKDTMTNSWAAKLQKNIDSIIPDSKKPNTLDAPTPLKPKT